MGTLANIVWILFGGLVTALIWCVVGIFFCASIIGIPLGRQCFKMARLTLAPFGLSVTYGGGAPSLIANLIWLAVGIPLALAYCFLGLLWCTTIVGIPFGVQIFKMAKLSLMPFGSTIS